VEQGLNEFDGQSFDGANLTIVDMAADLAPTLSIVLETPLGIAFVSQGRDVTDGMGDLDTAALAAAITTEVDEGAHGALVASA
jgi:hypothetical protein